MCGNKNERFVECCKEMGKIGRCVENRVNKVCNYEVPNGVTIGRDFVMADSPKDITNYFDSLKMPDMIQGDFFDSKYYKMEDEERALLHQFIHLVKKTGGFNPELIEKLETVIDRLYHIDEPTDEINNEEQIILNMLQKHSNKSLEELSSIIWARLKQYYNEIDEL
jgi:hypothetical protein